MPRRLSPPQVQLGLLVMLAMFANIVGACAIGAVRPDAAILAAAPIGPTAPEPDAAEWRAEAELCERMEAFHKGAAMILAQDLYAHGGDLADIGERGAAVAAFRLAARLDPEWGLPLMAWSELAPWVGESPEARLDRAARLERWMGVHGGSARVWRLLAVERAERGDHLGAIDLWRQVLAVRGDDRDARESVADLLRATGQATEALAELSRLVEAHPHDPGLRLKRADLLESLGRLGEAEADLTTMIGLGPSPFGGLVALAAFHERHGRTSEARDLRKRIADLTRPPPPPKRRGLLPSRR